MVNVLTFLVLPVVALCAPHRHHQHAKRSDSNLAHVLQASAGTVHLKNHCKYDVHVKPFPGPGCSAGKGGKVSKGASWNDTLEVCATGNTALKVYRSGSTKPMQFEYGIDHANIWYDMSFIDCVESGSDFSSCAGAGWAMRGNSECHAYSCTGGAECCSQGYCDPWATGVDPAPNTGCGADQGYTDPAELGIVIELCAESQ